MTSRENFQESGRESQNSTREENRKKGQKGLSRALLIFTGKKKTLPNGPSKNIFTRQKNLFASRKNIFVRSEKYFSQLEKYFFYEP